MDTIMPWGLVILSFTLWFLLKPLLDPRSYIKVGVTFTLTLLITLLTTTNTEDCVPLFFYLIPWSFVYFVIFFPTLPAASFYKSENPLVGTMLFLTLSWSLTFGGCNLSKTGIILYSVASVFLWKTGGNYMSNRPKSVGLSVLCASYISNIIPIGQTLPFIWFSILVYCNIERCLSIAETWPKLCPGNGLVSDILYSLFQLKDEDLPEDEIANLRDTFSILYTGNTVTERIGFLTILLFAQGVRLITAPMAIMMKRLDDVTDDQTTYTQAEALKELHEARCFFDELFQGRVKDWDFGLWPRPKGYNTPPPVNVERYIKSIPSVEPCVLRVLVIIGDYIPPKVAYDFLDSFVWERTNGVVNTEEDLLWWCTRANPPITHMIQSAVMSKYYFQPISIPVNCQQRYIEVMNLVGYAVQMGDIAMDIPEDSVEGKVFFPKEWMLDENDYDILKVKRDPWTLGKQTLQIYSLKLLEKGAEYAQRIPDYLDKELLQIYPRQLQRCLVNGPEIFRVLYEFNKDRREYTRNIFHGNHIRIFLFMFKIFFLPYNTPYGWMIH